jgi:3-hydroxyacyl-CoA dehydrogenase
MKKRIKKVGVLGSGVMGSGIAAHLANAGVRCIMLDIVLPELSEDDRKKGLTKESKEFRNKLAMLGKQNALNSKPAALFSKNIADLIEIGNFEDDFDRLKDCDWVVEVVKEDLKIKNDLFKRIEREVFRPGMIVSSNTSGIPISKMMDGLSTEFKKHFLVTHFFNPVRYMKLLEIIPGPETSKEVIDTISEFGEVVLGKGIVYGKDTPNFVANRIGVFTIMYTMKKMMEENYEVDEVDAIVGKPMGKPKTAAFGTVDLVGLDTLVHVFKNVYESLTHDEERETFKTPEFWLKMVEKGLLGNKAKAGFYKKDKATNQKYTIDWRTLEYREFRKYDYESLAEIKGIEDVGERVRKLISYNDRAGKFAWDLFAKTVIYATNRIGEIADDIVNIDNAMKWGFNWDKGPFEGWDAVGLEETVNRMKAEGYKVPEKIEKMLSMGYKSFYKTENGKRYFFDFNTYSYKEIPPKEGVISIKTLRDNKKVIEENDGATIYDIGDEVLLLEFHTKMNAIDADIIAMMNRAVDLAEKSYRGIVIGNEAQNFSVGANIFLLLGEIMQGNWKNVEYIVKAFQDANMRIKFAQVPVVGAAAGMALGGGCEVLLHCDRVQACGESYIGLVEVGVGLLPAGGGTKETLLRYLEPVMDNPNVDTFYIIAKAFEQIAMAKVATSALEAKEFKYLRGCDGITMNRDRVISDAKKVVLHLSELGYRPPLPFKFRLPGESAYATIWSTLETMKNGNYITEYDMHIGKKIAWVMCGGVTSKDVLVDEQYVLDLEREAFLSLCGEQKTQERIQYMLMNNKPLRN